MLLDLVNNYGFSLDVVEKSVVDLRGDNVANFASISTQQAMMIATLEEIKAASDKCEANLDSVIF